MNFAGSAVFIHPPKRRMWLLSVSTAALIMVVGAAICIGVAGYRANRAKASSEKSAVTRAIVSQLVLVRTDLEKATASTENREIMQNAPSSNTIVSLPATLGRQAQIKGAQFAGVSIAQFVDLIARQHWGQFLDRAPTATISDGMGRAIHDDTHQMHAPASGNDIGFVTLKGEFYAGATVMGTDKSQAVGLRKLDDGVLKAIQDQSGVQQISVASLIGALKRSDGIEEVALHTQQTNGSTDGAYLVWKPERPGDDLIIRYGLLLLGCTILIAAILIEHARRSILRLRFSEAQARRLSESDPLTGLPNRTQFTQLMNGELARSQRGGGAFALMALDIDRLKEVNDACGHEAGDRMINAIVARITKTLRPGDRLARIDGDEFAILQTEIAGPKDCEKLASRILESLRESVDLGTLEVRARMSIGIALYPADATTREDLLQAASHGLLMAKKDGRDRFVFFEKTLGEDMRARRMREDELRKAIEVGGLVVYYQPIMSADGTKVSCVEALVRWPHPQRGLVPPDHFIALAEERGLILPLGEFVLRQACRDGKRWPGIRVAVNVSPIQFRQKDFAKMVERVLLEEQFDPTWLELELTEGVVIGDEDQAESIMVDLRGLGIRLALDDFGTGYSSLVYLRRFAFDKIKIDKSFLEATETTGESAIILHSIIHLGRALGLTVTAEGIETSEQQRFLQAAGAHELQGYLFSRPVPRENIDRMMAMQNGDTKSTIRAVAS